MSSHTTKRYNRVSAFARAVVITMATGALATGALVLSTATPSGAALFTQCPAIGADTGCGILIGIPSVGPASVTTASAPAQGPYDGNDDTLIGVQNSSSQTITSIPLTGTSDVFGFDKDGLCTYVASDCTGNTSDNSGYGGPISYFTGINGAGTQGTVNFQGGLAPGASTYFSLEGAINGANITISKASPTINTTPTGGTVGGNVSDSATLSGGSSPTGTVTFALYNNSTCSGTPLSTTSPKNLSGLTATSGNVSVSAAGTDYWIATYNGDSNNNGVASACGEATTVAKASPGINTTPTNGVAGGNVSDSATVTGGSSPSGNVTFKLYSGATCNGTVLSSTTGTLSGGTASSGNVPVSTVGSYVWIATYNGDTNNNSVASACGETTTVGKGTPAINTTPSNGVAGGNVSDSATVTGGSSPSGNVTFKLYSGATCNGTVLSSTTGTLSGGTASSGNVPVSTVGSYVWIATYNGDTNNNSVASACGETTTVGKTTSSVTLTVPMGGPAGGTVSDVATVSGANPTGTVTFTLYPNVGCTGTPTGTGTGSLSGGVATSTAVPVASPGTYYWIDSYGGDGNNNGSSSLCGEPTTVGKATSAVTGTVPTGGPAGGTVSDVATVSGANPTGTVTFVLYNNANCSGSSVGTGTGSLSGGSATSTAVPVTTAGTYYWIATYGGDGNNNGSASACGEPTTVGKATSAVTGTVPTGGPAGGTVSDVATVSGANPTGTVTFVLYNNANCSGSSVGTGTGSLSGGSATSTAVPVTTAGTYYWIATYGGDGNNNGSASACGEPTTVGKATSAVTGTVPTGGPAGGSVSDVATVSGANPTGTVTFVLYNNANCSGSSVGTGTGSLSGGSATSTAVPVTTAGTYYWIATYGGDGNNNGSASACGEPTTVGKATSAVTGTVPTGGPAGGSVSDTATVAGVNPTGTVTFVLYGNSTCTGTPTGSGTGSLSGGVATSTAVPVPTAGTYYWLDSYPGDNNNNSSSSACGEPTTVGKATSVVIGTVPSGGQAGGTVSDTATISGAGPTGTVTFTLFSNSTCSGTPVGSGTGPVIGGSASSGPVSVSAATSFWWIATYSGDNNNSGSASPCGEMITVGKATSAAVGTTPSGGVAGGSVSDIATVSGGANPTGTVTFDLYSNATCTLGTLVGTATTGVSGSLALSGPLSVSTAGTYYWIDTYSGDTNNVGSASTCGEATSVGLATSAVTGTVPSGGPVGGSVSDTATVSGASPTGTVTFTLYGNSSCSGTPLGSGTGNLSGGSAASGPISVSTAGTLYWIATYNGDTNNDGSASLCGEATTVTKATPSGITTTPSGTVTAGGSVSDSATVSGGVSPTGTVTFTLYNNASCNPPASGSGTGGLTGGTAGSGNLTVSAAGTYYWIATYNGDTNNNSISSSCGEAVVVTKAKLTITAPTLTTTYGTIPPLPPTYSGFVGTDTVASLTTPAHCVTTATVTSSPGTYPVTCSGAVDPTYTFKYVPGTLTIVAAPTNWTISEVLTTKGKDTTDVLTEHGLPPGAIGTVYFETQTGIACAVHLTGLPGEVTSCVADFGGNVPFVISAVFVDEDQNYLTSYASNTLLPHS